MRGYLLYGFDLLMEVWCFLLQVLSHFIGFVSNDSEFSIFCLHTTINNKLSHIGNSLIGNFKFYHCLFCQHQDLYSSTQVNILSLRKKSQKVMSTLLPHSGKYYKQEDGLPSAMSQDDPYIDLLNTLDTHRCDLCLTPLQKYTKVIAQRATEDGGSSNQGFKVFCVICFSGWSKVLLDPECIEEATYRYFVCRKLDRPIEEFKGWSPFEILQLHRCIEEFGPQVNTESRNYFFKTTQLPKGMTELASKYKELKQQLYEPNGVTLKTKGKRVKWNSSQNSFKNKALGAKRIIKSLELKGKDEEKQAFQFLKLINYNHPVQKARKYPDISEHYFSRSIATNDLVQETIGPLSQTSHRFSEDQIENTVNILTKMTKQKARSEREVKEFITFLCHEYATLRRRNRKCSQLQEIKAWMQLEELSHPEVHGLLDMEGMKEELKMVIDLKKQRESFFGEMKEKRKLITSRRSSEKLSQREQNSDLSEDERDEDGVGGTVQGRFYFNQ